MATSSSSGSDASRVRVQPERRQQPDLAKLAAALIELATEQLNNHNTSTPSVNLGDAKTVTTESKPPAAAPTRRRRRAA